MGLALGCVAAVVGASLVHSRMFRTPEGAAFDAYMRYEGRLSRERIHLHDIRTYAEAIQPSDSGNLKSDLARWTDRVILLRDSTELRPRGSDSSVSTTELRRGYALPGVEAESSDIPILIVDRCLSRDGLCGGGAQVMVRRFLLWYYARRVSKTWVV